MNIQTCFRVLELWLTGTKLVTYILWTRLFIFRNLIVAISSYWYTKSTVLLYKSLNRNHSTRRGKQNNKKESTCTFLAWIRYFAGFLMYGSWFHSINAGQMLCNQVPLICYCSHSGMDKDNSQLRRRNWTYLDIHTRWANFLASCTKSWCILSLPLSGWNQLQKIELSATELSLWCYKNFSSNLPLRRWLSKWYPTRVRLREMFSVDNWWDLPFLYSE